MVSTPPNRSRAAARIVVVRLILIRGDSGIGRDAIHGRQPPTIQVGVPPQCRENHDEPYHHWRRLDRAEMAQSLAQTERMAASSARPVGHAALALLAKYQRISAEVAVRPPGISRKPFVSVFRTQSQAYCSHLAR